MSEDEVEARIRGSFARQSMMATLGCMLLRISPGEVDIALPVAGHILQQHGFVHGGAVSCLADSAAGFASLTGMPATAGVLTVEFKINLVAPAKGDRLVARGRVLRPGRTLTLAQAEVFAEDGSAARMVAYLTATMMRIDGRAGVVD